MPGIIQRIADWRVAFGGALASPSRPALPNLVIIGAMKCGTTSLHRYLNLHPAVSMSNVKELDFFIETRNWRHGIEWYASHFNAAAAIRGESSPNYTAASPFPGVPERMARVIPDAKLIYIVRDPIRRMISQYIHALSSGTERREFGEVVRAGSYVERSMYWFQISKYLEYFDTSQILILEAEDLRQRRCHTLRRVFDFVGVDPRFYSNRFRDERHRSAQKRRMTDLGLRLKRSAFGRWVEGLPQPWRSRVNRRVYFLLSRPIERPIPTKQQLLELVHCLQEDVMQFREWTGRQFPTWSL